jgi:hypothetical protein
VILILILFWFWLIKEKRAGLCSPAPYVYAGYTYTSKGIFVYFKSFAVPVAPVTVIVSTVLEVHVIVTKVAVFDVSTTLYTGDHTLSADAPKIAELAVMVYTPAPVRANVSVTLELSNWQSFVTASVGAAVVAWLIFPRNIGTLLSRSWENTVSNGPILPWTFCIKE